MKAASLTVNIAHLTLERVKVLQFPLPPSAEQAQIVSEVERLLSIADATEQAIKQSLRQAERMRQSILKRAFEGKLVPQVPADEPAEVLLARIKTGRAQNGGAAGKPSRQTRRRKQPGQPDMLP